MRNIVTKVGLIGCLLCAVSTATFTAGCAGDRYSRSTGETIDDAGITTKVKAALLANDGTRGVKVIVNRGDVQLSGFVDTDADRKQALDLARNVKGVQNVKNDILLK